MMSNTGVVSLMVFIAAGLAAFVIMTFSQATVLAKQIVGVLLVVIYISSAAYIILAVSTVVMGLIK